MYILSICMRNFRCQHLQLRHMRTFAVDLKNENKRKMRGWYINSYGDLDKLEFSKELSIPSISTSTDILVKVQAAGINPIDVAMVGGYGTKLLNTMRCAGSGTEFPLTLGREFSGVVVQKGMGKCNNLKIGDFVWGVLPVHKTGCHVEYVVIPEYCVTKKPVELSHIEAAGVLYAGLTAWSGLFITGKLGGLCGTLTSLGGGRGKRVLVLGASGGVGSLAVQILKAENASVIASCSTDAIPMVKELGADCTIDYTNKVEINKFASYGPYDIIFDCSGQGEEYAEKYNWNFKTFVTLSSPLLKNIDTSGLGFGIIKNISDIIETNTKSVLKNGGCIKWGYFIPAPQGIAYLKKLIERKRLLPIIDSVYGFNDAIDAYKKVNEGHLRGKVVIDFEKINSERK